MPRFSLDHACDYTDGGEKCGARPTANACNYYYGCKQHYDALKQEVCEEP